MSANNRHVRLLAICSIWTLTSFLCHFMARRFLVLATQTYGESLQTTLLSVILLSGSQILFCVLLIDRPDSDSSTNHGAITYILGLHALAALLTNSSMAVIFAASTFAIKLLEPITGAIAQRLLLGTKLSRITLVSLPIIVIGAMMFTGNPLSEVTMSIGTTLACISNVSLALRNVAVKRQHISKTEIKWRKIGTYLLVTYFVTVISYNFFQYSLNIKRTYHDKLLTAIALLIGSSLFHVIYSYISTAIVLKELSVVSHAVGNIFKRLFVIMLLYMGGKRTASVDNFLGLIVCILGLLLYTWDKLRKTSPSILIKHEDTEGSTLGVFTSFFMYFLNL